MSAAVLRIGSPKMLPRGTRLTLLLASAQLCFGGGLIAKAVLPFRFQAAGNQPILRIHGPVAALGPFGADAPSASTTQFAGRAEATRIFARRI